MWTRLGPKVILVRYFGGTEEVVGSKIQYLCGRIWRRNFGGSEQSWALDVDNEDSGDVSEDEV